MSRHRGTMQGASGCPCEVFASMDLHRSSPGSQEVGKGLCGHFTNWLFQLVIGEVLAFLPWHPARSYCRTFSQKGVKKFPNFNV